MGFLLQSGSISWRAVSPQGAELNVLISNATLWAEWSHSGMWGPSQSHDDNSTVIIRQFVENKRATENGFNFADYISYMLLSTGYYSSWKLPILAKNNNNSALSWANQLKLPCSIRSYRNVAFRFYRWVYFHLNGNKPHFLHCFFKSNNSCVLLLSTIPDLLKHI